LTVPIIAQTNRYVVVDKPSGLLSVPGKGPDKADCVASRIRLMFPDALGPVTIHRLDMDTSGLLVVALDPETHRSISMQFEAREVEKTYVALLAGDVKGESGTIDEPLRTDIDNRPYQIIDHTHGRRAITDWRVLARETDRTRVEFIPRTGRTHQLRVHAAHRRGLNCPILGDRLYGDETSAPRLMLHAETLSFIDPATNRRIDFAAPVPF
jgi:tRNA pseudouridine32 synthase / 23S rRNA pseudouridine746 synthase